MTQCLYFVIFEAAGWGRHFFVAASSAQCYLLVVVVLGHAGLKRFLSGNVLLLPYAMPLQARLAMFGRSTNFFTVAAHTPYTWPLPAVLGKMVLTRQSFKSQGSFWPSCKKGYVIYRQCFWWSVAIRIDLHCLSATKLRFWCFSLYSWHKFYSNQKIKHFKTVVFICKCWDGTVLPKIGHHFRKLRGLNQSYQK